LLLKPGMTATAEIVVAQAADAVFVPNAALRFTPPTEGESSSLFPSPPGGTRVTTDEPGNRVWTLANNQPTAVNVVVGPSDGESTQVMSGAVKPGDAVIIDIVQARR
jgi:HlyD family secretion protein